jgi:hypothetical protein
MPVPEALIIGLGIRQAEFGLIEKQKRWLLGLETTGLEGLAAVIRALAVATPLGRKNTALLAATGQEEFWAHHSWLCSPRSTGHERRSNCGRSTTEFVRGSLWCRRVKHMRVRRKDICS